MSDWYANQAGSGSADGTSLADAWAVASIVWGAGGVVAGDTLYLDGEIYGAITVGASGTPGNPITIRFNEGALLWPSEDASGGWTNVLGFDVYYKTVDSNYRYDLFHDGERVQPIDHDNSPDTRGTEAALMTENTWRMRGSVEMMFYAPGGVDPDTLDSLRATDRAQDGGYGALDMRGQDHITVIDMNIRGARWNGGMPAAFTSEGDGVTIIGGYVEHCERVCKVYGGAKFGIIGLYARDLVSTGISLLGATSAGTPVSNPLTNAVVKHCTIINVGYNGRYRGLDWSITGDNDGIGIGYEGGNITDLEISDNHLENCGPQWAKDADVPSYFTSSDMNRGAGIYVGTSEVVAIDVDNISILRNTITGTSRFAIHLGAECNGTGRIIGNEFTNTGRYVAFDGVLKINGTENDDNKIYVCHNKFDTALARGGFIFANANANDSRYVYGNTFENCDKVADATGESWQGDVWRFTSGTWQPAADLEDYNLHGDRTGLSSAIIARDSGNTTYTTLSAYQAATTYSDNSLEGSADTLGAGGDWWTALGLDAPIGNNGLRFMSPPSIGSNEVRTVSGSARLAVAMPIRVLPAGVDIAKARAA